MHRSTLSSFLGSLFLLATAAPVPAQFLRYVDCHVAASGDGETWATAFETIEEALDEARSLGDYDVWIWVREGTYSRGTDTWWIPGNVSLYGGFRGTEARVEARDVAAHPTVLDGTARPLPVGIYDLYRPLLLMHDSAVLDGFTIRNCCTLSAGSALQVYNSDLMIDVTTVRGCTFENNQSAADGGAIATYTLTRLECTDCRFAWNSSLSAGGAIRASYYLTLQRCQFVGNEAANGGGVSACDAGPGPSVYNCVFSGNVATYSGGGIQLDDRGGTVLGCTFHGNQAYYGGGISNAGYYYPVTLSACVLWQNRNEANLQTYDQQIYSPDVLPVLQSCCIKGWTIAAGGTACTASDPLLRNAYGPDGIAGTGDEDLGLTLSSPCVDAGVWSSELADLDCRRAARRVAARGLLPRMDMGAFEFAR